MKGGSIDDLVKRHAETIAHFAIDRGELNVFQLSKTKKGLKFRLSAS